MKKSIYLLFVVLMFIAGCDGRGGKTTDVNSEKPQGTAIDNAKWSEGKAIMGTMRTAIRAYGVMRPDGGLPKSPGDLGFVAGDLEGTYFGESDFSFSVSSLSPLSYVIVCRPQAKPEAPTVPVRMTLNQDGVWTSE